MRYQHQWLQGKTIDFPVGQVVCVGRNYAAHARELNNPIPDEPVLFMKPPSAIQPLEAPLAIAEQFVPVHYETELAVLITKPLFQASEQAVKDALGGMTLALDLTRREEQSRLKQKGLPWERAKAFAGSAAIGRFVAVPDDWCEVAFSLSINGEMRQQGNSATMLMPVIALIQHISQTFWLNPGDIVLTGTPEGVGVLENGDLLSLSLEGQHLAQTQVEVQSGEAFIQGKSA
ncbi:fumarylacetoacetate hydrolase family protein [Salinivibrio sharmensis]|uniref:Isomerase/hydrolase n=1 Tax=Salinivibrio sharmensis TaxID=390883 RepID=A0ABX3KIQ6_9GAMM|nr:fumarylacetoacetate hydrolase family protein [Salinivibrio sharmensis]OOE89241.1 isomerase/hydrolase [Salinivibrio sharmensis]